jgi:Fe-S cluster assembly scaffold protein SufB
MKPAQTVNTIYSHTDVDPHDRNDPNVARLTINENKVLESNTVPGLTVEVKELADGVDIKMELEDHRVIEKPVHLCFGVIPQKGIQRILLDVVLGKYSQISLRAHCVFPFAVDVQHLMNAKIRLKEGASYAYFERHVHSDSGGVKVIPKAEIHVDKHARFKTEFELLRGRVGLIDIDYVTYAQAHALVDMTARISGSADDRIKISETSILEGEYARAVLTSKVAVRDSARAEVFNKVTALAPYARGHVDCKEIVKDDAIAIANPIVDVRDARSHVTHEAAVGSVDKKQLETLMARGLDEDEASELIIQGLLS